MFLTSGEQIFGYQYRKEETSVSLPLKGLRPLFIEKNWYNVLMWVTGHCNRAAVSRNRYGVEKTVDTHTILINTITFYVCLQEI